MPEALQIYRHIGAGSMTVTMVEALRFAVWLEGTTLVARHALGAARCDLARSGVNLGTFRGLPRLLARDGVTGRRVRLVLGHPHNGTMFAPPSCLP
jgi:hypothetical protein